MGAWIRAISYYLPEEMLTNEALASEFPEWDVDKVYNKVGVRIRHLAGRTETAGDLAEKAARKLGTRIIMTSILTSMQKKQRKGFADADGIMVGRIPTWCQERSSILDALHP